MTENKKENLNNRMIKFLFEGAPVRGACVQMAEEWQEMIKFHHYPENVAALLGQFTAGALLLSSTIKFEGSLILQVKGSGPDEKRSICLSLQRRSRGFGIFHEQNPWL